MLGTLHASLLASQRLRGRSQSKASKQNTDVAAIVLKHCTNKCASGRTGQMAPAFHHAAGPTSATNLVTFHRLRSQNHQAIHTCIAFVADTLSALATSTHDIRILNQVRSHTAAHNCNDAMPSLGYADKAAFSNLNPSLL